MKEITYLILISTWMGGIVGAVGWMKLLAIFFPFYAWYLVIEKLIQLNGMA